MTANVMKGDREKCIDAGMDDYISKPIRIEEIENVINRWGYNISSTEKIRSDKSKDVILDLEKIESLRKIGREDKGFLLELIGMFLEQAPYYIAQIQEHTNESRFDKLEVVAHTLKGTSANIGARKLMQICEQIEKVAKRSDASRINSLMEDLNTIYNTTARSMKELMSPE
jgi:HPt (histidine-containing phosphotransfer) domain-containing protein